MFLGARSRSLGRSERRLGAAVALLLVGSAVLFISPLVAGVSALRPITGTPGPDEMRGSAAGDLMRGLGGNDRIWGFRGPDRIVGGNGADVLTGGAGRDRIEGGFGADRINADDGVRDSIDCGRGVDIVTRDRFDLVHFNCEVRRGWRPTPPTQPVPTPVPSPTPPPSGQQVILVDQPWVCRGRVNLDLVRVTLRTRQADAVALDQDCSGRVGRIEVETWTADGIKIQNRGTVAHDLVIESGYVKCHAVSGASHQDGIQAMGGSRITFKNLKVDCLRNSNLYLSRGGSGASMPTDIVCEGCVLGPNSGQTLFYNRSLRSGARNTTICTGRFTAVRVNPGAEQIVNQGNTILPRNHPTCADVTGRGRGSR